MTLRAILNILVFQGLLLKHILWSTAISTATNIRLHHHHRHPNRRLRRRDMEDDGEDWQANWLVPTTMLLIFKSHNGIESRTTKPIRQPCPQSTSPTACQDHHPMEATKQVTLARTPLNHLETNLYQGVISHGTRLKRTRPTERNWKPLPPNVPCGTGGPKC